MAYPALFHRLVMIGTHFTDIFNVSISLIPVGGSTPALINGAMLASHANAVATWWPKTLATSGGGIGITGNAKLTSIKLNRINTAGHYNDPDAMEYVFPTPVAGGGNTNPVPPQLTLAATLRGSSERALAGRGRMYFPPCSLAFGLGPDGRVTVTDATNYATGVGNLLAALHTAGLATTTNSQPGIASNTRSGAFQSVATITAGRVIDTMRSRRNKLAEDPQQGTYV
jgi:hypothetical protein